jgi:hypothetical protein
LWHPTDARVWQDALAHYWDLVKVPNREMEQRLEGLNLDQLRQMDARDWYNFLRDEYAPTSQASKQT